MGERVNGVLYLDSIPGKNFSKQLVLDVSEWNFSTHVYGGFPHDVNTIKVVSRVSKEDAKELEKWFMSCVTSSCVEGDYAKGKFCTFFNSGKIQCRIDIDMIYPFKFSQENWNEHNDNETEETLIKMELHCRGLTVVERNVSPTPLCTTSFPLTEVFQIERTDSKTVYELYKNMDDANTRISEIGETNITVKRLAVIKDAQDSHT